MTTWTQVTTLTAPTAGVFDMPGLTLTGYRTIHLVVSGVTVTTDGTDPKLTFYVAGVEIVTGYRWGLQGSHSGAAGVDDGSTSASAILLVSDNANWDVGNAAGEGFGSIITVDNPNSTALHKHCEFQSSATGPTSVTISTFGVGVMENVGAITGFKISGTSNLLTGNVRVLGAA